MTLEQARAELLVLHHNYRESFPGSADADWSPTLDPLSIKLTEHLRQGESTLWKVVVCVLVLAGCNVAGLLFTHFATRRREMAIRLALGASRFKLLSAFVQEGFLLGLLAGVLGLGLTSIAVQTIPSLAPDIFPDTSQIGINSSSAIFALLVACAVGSVSALIPSLLEVYRSPAHGIKAGASVLAGAILPWEWRVRQVIVTTQVALSLCLLAGAFFLTSSFRKLGREDTGFHSDGVSFGMFYLPPTRYADAARCEIFARRMLDEVGALPQGVEATIVTNLPLTGAESVTYARLDGRAAPPEQRQRAIMHGYSPGSFSFLRVPLLLGRDFTVQDTSSSPPVVIISRSSMDTVFAGENPLGRRLLVDDLECEIIGVAADIRSERPSKINDVELYRPLTQLGERFGMIALRGLRSDSAFSYLRAALRNVDPALPLIRPQSLDYYVSGSVGRERLLTVLIAVFAIISLVIAIVGVGTAVSYLVLQRTRELGVRMALGATPDNIRGFVTRKGIAPVALGLFSGLGLIWALQRTITSHLYRTTAHDPILLASAAGVLFILAILVCSGVACRVAKMSPADALKN